MTASWSRSGAHPRTVSAIHVADRLNERYTAEEGLRYLAATGGVFHREVPGVPVLANTPDWELTCGLRISGPATTTTPSSRPRPTRPWTGSTTAVNSTACPSPVRATDAYMRAPMEEGAQGLAIWAWHQLYDGEVYTFPQQGRIHKHAVGADGRRRQAAVAPAALRRASVGPGLLVRP